MRSALLAGFAGIVAVGCGSGGSADAAGGGDAADAVSDSSGADAVGSGTPLSYFLTIDLGGTSGSQLSASESIQHAGAPLSGTCAIQSVGTCTVASSCVLGAGTWTEFSAGTITVNGAGQNFSETPDMMGRYQVSSVSGSGWTVGQPVTIGIGAGQTVPMFSTMLDYPASIAITTPASGATAAIDRSAGFTVTWTPPSATSQSVLLRIFQTDYPIECVFDASTGTGTVPAAALATLDVDSAGTLTHVEVGSGAHVDTMLGGGLVRIDAWMDSIDLTATVQ